MLVKDIAKINPSKTSNYLEFINYVDTSSVSDGKLLSLQNLVSDFPSRAQRQLNINDILISSVRPKLLHNYFVKDIWDNMIASTGFIQIRVINPNYVPRYIYYFLTNNNNVSLYTSIANTSQTTFPSFNKDVIENIKLPDISYNDQLRIVDIITY